MISAKEARKIGLDIIRNAQVLSEEAVNKILADADAKILEAAKMGLFEVSVSMEPINRLNDINVEAAKRSIHLLSGYLERGGYTTGGFTNFTKIVHINWTQRVWDGSAPC